MSEAAPLICACCGQVRLDEIDRRLLKLSLSPTQTAIANMLSRFAPQAVSMEDLIQFLWGNDENGGPDDAANCAYQHLYYLEGNLPSVGLHLARQPYRRLYTITVAGEVKSDV